MFLSIIIPVFNTAQFLRECLDSIFGQAALGDDVEVICVNDGSSDDSLSILQEYAARAESLSLCFHYWSQTNQGQGAARNRALERASGEWIWMIDSDDWILPDSFGRLRRIAGSVTDDTDLIWFNGRMHYEKDGTEKTDVGYDVKSISGRSFYENYSVVRRYFNFVCPVLFLYRREFLLNNNLFFKEGVFHEDFLFIPQVCFSARNVTVADDICYVYRYRSSGSTVTTPNRKRISDMLTICRDLTDLSQQCRSKILSRNIFTAYLDLFVLNSKYGGSDNELKKEIDWDFLRRNRFISPEYNIYYHLLRISPQLMRSAYRNILTARKGFRKVRRIASHVIKTR